MTTMLETCGTVLEAFVRGVVRLRWLVVIVVLLAAPLALRHAAVNLGINTDTANMIAMDLPWRAAFDRYRDLYPVRDRNLVVVVESDDANAAADAASELAARMRDEPDLYPSVFLGGDGEFFARNGLLFLSVEELETLSDRLVNAQPLIGQLAGSPGGAGVVDLLAQIYARSQSAPAAEAAALTEAVADVLEAAGEGETQALDWRTVLRMGAEPETRQLILVRPALDFSRMRPARDAIEQLRQWIADLQTDASMPVRMRLTGTIAMEHEELDSVVRSASLAGTLALVMVIAVLLWALRSLRLLAISLVVLAFGLLVTAALAASLVGHLNLLSVAFAVLYVGLGVDFILHISLRVRESLADGEPIESAIATAMRTVGASLVVCTLTTAAGFYAFVPSRLFTGISELGLIAGTGMFVSFAVSITLLPALLACFYRSRHGRIHIGRGVRLTAFAVRRARGVVAATIAVVAAAAVSLPFVYFDSNPVNLRDPRAESVVALAELAADSDADLLAMVALFADSAQAEPFVAAFEMLDEVREVRTVQSLVPDEQAQKVFLLEDLQFVLGPSVESIEYFPSAAGELAGELSRLHATLQTLDDNGPLEQRLSMAISRLETGTTLSTDSAADLDRALFGNLSDQLNRLALALQATEFDGEDLPAELRERWVAEDGTVLIEIVPSENIRDNEAAARFVAAVRGVLDTATGLPVVYNEAASAIVTSFRQALIYAFVAIAVILLVFVRSVRDCGMVLVPIVCATLVTAGATVWFGIPFNFANIIALPLLIGVGVDNAIHMMHRLRASPGDVDFAAGSTSAAVLASGLTTIASFGNLAFSSHRGMATMGLLLTAGMIAMMLATLGFLPALLRAGERR